MGNASSRKAFSDRNLCVPTFEGGRTTYFPGNLCRGHINFNIPADAVNDEHKSTYAAASSSTAAPSLGGCGSNNFLEYNAIRVRVECLLWYHWQTTDSEGGTYDHYIDEIIHRQTITLAGDREAQTPLGGYKGKNSHRIPVGKNYSLDFAAMLPSAALPSLHLGTTSAEVKIIHRAVTIVDVGGEIIECGKAVFSVFGSMSAQQYALPSSKTGEKKNRVKCCGCWGCCLGDTFISATLDKTILSLQDDKIRFTAKIDNSEAKDEISSITASLMCTAVPQTGLKVYPVKYYFSQEYPLNLKSGDSKDVSGEITLRPGAPASFSSSVVNIQWYFVIQMKQEGCCSSSSQFKLPVFVSHHIDATGQAELCRVERLKPQNFIIEKENAKTMKSIAMLTGKFEVPNLADPRYLESLPNQLQQLLQLNNSKSGKNTSSTSRSLPPAVATGAVIAADGNDNDDNNNNGGGMRLEFSGNFPQGDYFMQAHNSNSSDYTRTAEASPTQVSNL